MASALALAGEDSKRRLPRKVQANEQREEMAQTMPRGMALMGPARPARGELRQPKRKTATPRMPEAAPAPTVWELMPRVKLAVMSILNDMYGITEEDFLSAELAAVPAFDVCEVGLDRSLIGGYGHDDRVCAYAELKAIFDVQEPERSCVCILADKEETGSDGVTGMQSACFDVFMKDLCESQGVPLRRCYEKSFCLSADVSNAFDPLYPEVSEKRSDSKVNYGMAICKFTGARGKGGTSDASAELVAYLRRLYEREGVVWQMAELGKVDQGGGGTIAKFMANRNIDTIDAGVPVLSMHAPFEVVAKFDCYMTYKGVLAAYADK